MPFDITRMTDPGVYDHPVEDIELIETHISWVMLTGRYAYKIKKPVDFGFLDFSTLQKRAECCHEELRLNRRLATDIYLEVVAITETGGKLRLAGDGDGSGDSDDELVEYAVKMLQFPQSCQLDNLLAEGKLQIEHIDACAHMIASFHQSVEVAGADSAYGDEASVYNPVLENFEQIAQHMDTRPYAHILSTLKSWNNIAFNKLRQTVISRKADGYIRECHGDMHLRNMVLIDDQPMAFDCIEFNAGLRWIDIISEVAFLMMDLQDRAQHTLANRFINTYLEDTGDYAGLALLSFYLSYRAMVRAKVNCLRLEQDGIDDDVSRDIMQEFEVYLELALSYTEQKSPSLIIMRGLSASGKSTISQQLVDNTGAIRIRSDVERKRMFDSGQRNDVSEGKKSQIEQGIYSQQASRATYDRLMELAEKVIRAGYNVIVDAAFLKKQQRELFRSLAKRLEVPYTIVEVTAPPEILRQRISQRENDVSDADLSVLEHQLASYQPLQEPEAADSVIIDTTKELDIAQLAQSITG